MRRIILATAIALLLAGIESAAAEEVTFTYVPFEGETVTGVSLRGTMNEWGETAMERREDGAWSITVDLEPGEYRYKFFVNGEWPKDMEADHDGDPIDGEAVSYADDGHGGQNAVRTVGGGGAAEERPAREPAPPLGEGKARIHYHRPDGRYDGWGLHLWEDTPERVDWNSPFPPAGEDPYGLYWDFRLNEGAQKVGFIVHQGDRKDPGPDMFLFPGEHGREVWLVSGGQEIQTVAPDVDALALGDIGLARAHWVAEDLLLWKGSGRDEEAYRLHWSADEEFVLTPEGVSGGSSIVLGSDPGSVDESIRERFPHLGRSGALRVSPADRGRIPEILKGRIALSATGADGKLRDATGVQIPGVLDDLFFTDEPLGVVWNEGAPSLRLWAPTARSVRLHLFDGSGGAEPFRIVDMTESRGVWGAGGGPDWNGKYYLYEVEVFAPSTGRFERNLVTDPYSRGLAMNSARSLIVDLDDPALKPDGWDGLAKPPLDRPEDIVLYELHVRDFSALDGTVPEGHRGTFLAFTGVGAGVTHLKSLAEAGLTHLHLLPVFDIATIDEDRSRRAEPGDLSRFPADSEAQQEAIGAVKDRDGFNWGYDPFHFGVPEGSYSTDPDGGARIVEFRRMVRALSDMGLRVVMDVVYNHTNGSGQSEKSVFDRIVPGYYHRLNRDGRVETSTCCANTATEHAMMERFMVDDLVHWARDYKVDGFRFDLMGHHMVRNMEKARDALRALTPEKDGVDGSAIYLYGEGWNFGEVADGKLGPNATQTNMRGTGIGTFNDRIRDAVRGGSAFGDPREQGFATGLFFDPNGFNQGGAAEKGRLLDASDRIRIGLAGNLADYRFLSHTGGMTRGADFSAVGYAGRPSETINYVSAHDNQTLYDKIVYAAHSSSSPDDLVRMQKIALAVVGLGQGIPFFHAGSDLLRSKSLDGDSYNSGDWFNRLDFTYETNNFGAGLPPAEKNRDRWPLMKPLLSRADRKPGRRAIEETAAHFREILRIRRSSPLFRLDSADEVQRRVRFHNTGPDQIPGLVAMELLDDGEAGPALGGDYRRIVVLFNAAKGARAFARPVWKEGAFRLHPVQASSADPVLGDARFDAKEGAFAVPGRTAAVFVEPR
ncbi:MAG: pullulanase-type alpha-1,6-glucosidase [Candidatus Eisenbacteria bacterium]